jgi:prepilin-type N-terminal cleavage/methylation domain-containing protein
MFPALVSGPSKGQRRSAMSRAFTLVEVMVATVLLSMIILGILQVMIGSYRVAAKARYRDHARYIIKSFADQFLTQQATDNHGNTLPFFGVTVDSSGNSTPLGTNLTWTNSDGTTGYSTPTAMPDTSGVSVIGLYFYVKLGDTTSAPITATVQRSIRYVYPSSDGAASLIVDNQPQGFLLEGDFSISYTYQNVPITQSITAVRAYP